MIRPVLTEIGIFLIPFAVYALFLIATRSGVLVSSSWPAHLVAKLVLGSLLLVVISFILLAHFSGAPPDSTYVPAHIENGKLDPRSREMSEARVLSDAPWLRSGPAARVLALLNGDGEEARVVGGAVRNALLKIPLGDIDIATTALPDEVVRRAKAAGIKCVPTGIDHGTVTLVVDAQPFEVTTLREDTETFGRKAKVAFGRDWVRDAERRDFTINGLSVDAGGIVHDHVGGLADIAARRVRFIGDAGQRIAEDYLRILRFFRMHAAYGAGEPDRAGYLACIGGRAGLAEPFRRTRADGDAEAGGRGRRAVAVQAMADGGLLLPIFGGVAYTGPFAAMIAAEHALGLPPNADAPAWRAHGGRHRGCQARRGAAASHQRGNQGAGFHGPPLVAARRHGRGDGRGGGSTGSARTLIATG